MEQELWQLSAGHCRVSRSLTNQQCWERCTADSFPHNSFSKHEDTNGGRGSENKTCECFGLLSALVLIRTTTASYQSSPESTHTHTRRDFDGALDAFEPSIIQHLNQNSPSKSTDTVENQIIQINPGTPNTKKLYKYNIMIAMIVSLGPYGKDHNPYIPNGSRWWEKSMAMFGSLGFQDQKSMANSTSPRVIAYPSLLVVVALVHVPGPEFWRWGPYGDHMWYKW